jgi:hypothetical protein
MTGLSLPAIGAALAAALSVTQSFISARVGSDHPVHVFLTQTIRANGFRLFVRIPRLLNTCYIAAVPLYLHWIVAHFPGGIVYWFERLLNPLVNAVHVLVVFALALVAARAGGAADWFAGAAACLFALTPQFYHALSARNFGMSARGMGLVLLTLFLFAAWHVEIAPRDWTAWLALALVGWLVWAFSTFAHQALAILSVILLCLGHWAPIAGAALGLGVFLAIHPAYGRGYLRHTLRFIHTYATQLAPIYILNKRYSVWRDLVLDIWRKLHADPLGGLRYAYENSLLIVCGLNPLVIVACMAYLGGARDGLAGFAGAVAVAGAVAMLGTSFRRTRFLGEPERYVEAVTPWSVVAALGVAAFADPLFVTGLGVAFLCVDLAQLYASRMLLRHVTGSHLQLDDVESALAAAGMHGVRFASNNEHFTKMLMRNDWEFAYCLAVGQDYCGMSVQEAFSTFPLLKRGSLERIVREYRVNVVLLDRNVFDTLFDERPPGLAGNRVVFESDRFRVLALDWADTAR